MSIRPLPLPENPSLENLRKQAKSLRKAVNESDAEALARVRDLHPRADAAIAHFSLSDAQLVAARGYGFPSWPKLKHHLDVVERFRWNPPDSSGKAIPTSPADLLVRLSCLAYGDWHPSGVEKALRLLAEHPELAREDISVAAAVGDISATRAILTRQPALVNAKVGPYLWEPLLYACYSRLDSADPRYSTLEVARLLLSAGADPNAGFLWAGNVPPFTALTGAFGEGEDGSNQPPHPRSEDLARLLLEAGADPNDGQTLYNRHFRQSHDHLKLLFAYGLGQHKRGPWYERLGDRLDSPSRLLVEELWSAARRNYPERVKLLVGRGAEVNTPGARDGRTPYEAAVRAGNLEIAAYLLDHGAKRIDASPQEAFAAACIAGQAQEARARLREDPALLEKLGHHGRVELLHRAVEANRPQGIRLMAELGFEFSDWTEHDRVGMNLAATPMHNAAWAGRLELVQLLIALGANPNVREPNYHATPLGWAAHNRQQHVVDYLMSFATTFEAVRLGGVDRVAELLRAEPLLVNANDEDGDPLVFWLQPDTPRLDEMITLLLAHGADLNALDTEGRTVLDRAVARAHEDLADTLRRHGALGRP